MKAFSGQGRVDVDAQFVREQASADPRPLPESESHELLGKKVAIAPSDYAKQATEGELVAVTDERYIITRSAAACGQVNVHFPRYGFDIRSGNL